MTAPTENGQGFLLYRSITDASPFVLVLNWFEELRTKVAK